MRTRRTRPIALIALTAVLAAIVVAAAPSPASAATSCVEPTGASGCFTTIQDAVDDASAGDTILIRRGTYLENVVIPAGLDGLTLRNQGSPRQIVLDPDAPNGDVGITIEANDVTLRGFTVVNGRSDAIRIGPGASGALVDRLSISGALDNCVRIEGPGATVRNSTLLGCARGVTGIAGSDGLTVERNRIEQCGSDCVNVDADDVTVRNNRARTAGDEGVVVIGDRARVLNNRVIGTRGEGYVVQCVPCTGGLVQGNLADFSATEDGFDIFTDAPGMVVKQNKSTSNADAGFGINGVEVRIERNVATGNGADRSESGFEIVGRGHELIRNTARDNHGDGFDIVAIDTGMITLDRNLAVANTDDGFDIRRGIDVHLSGNRALHNFGVGFEVDSDATDAFLTGNTGSRNRVDFCDEGTGTLLVGNTFATTGACVIG